MVGIAEVECHTCEHTWTNALVAIVDLHLNRESTCCSIECRIYDRYLACEYLTRISIEGNILDWHAYLYLLEVLLIDIDDELDRRNLLYHENRLAAIEVAIVIITCRNDTIDRAAESSILNHVVVVALKHFELGLHLIPL